MVQHIGEVFRIVVDEQRYHHQPQTQGGLVEGDPLPAVAQHDGNPVARPKALLLQGPLPAADQRCHLSPRGLFPLPGGGIELAVGDGIRRAPDPLPEQARKGGGLLRFDDVGGVLHPSRCPQFLILRSI